MMLTDSTAAQVRTACAAAAAAAHARIPARQHDAPGWPAQPRDPA
ncbi:hypothetical protein [Roseateles sp.]